MSFDKPQFSKVNPHDAHKRVKKIPKATHIEHRIDVQDVNSKYFDDVYGTSRVKNFSGEWKNVSLLSDTQLNANSDMLKGLVCIQVCDPTEFSMINANTMAAPIKKQLSKDEIRLNNKLGSYKAVNKFEDEGHNNEFQASLEKFPLAIDKPPTAVSAKDIINKKHALLNKVLATNAKISKIDAQQTKQLQQQTIAAAKATKYIPTQPEVVQKAIHQTEKSIKVQKIAPQKIDNKIPKKGDQKTLEQLQLSQLHKQSPLTINDPSDESGLQWFDDLSDDEFTKKNKDDEKKKKLKQKLELELFKAKMSLNQSLNDQFEEMHDIDEDEEFEMEELSMEEGSDLETVEKTSKSVKKLPSFVKYDGLDSSDSDDDQMLKPQQNKKKNTSTQLTPYTKPIAPHMHSLQHYLTKTIYDIEIDEQDNFSQESYYNTPNATLFHYHDTYQSWLPYNFHPLLQLAIIREQFTSPRPIQAEALLPALRDHKDVVGIAQTGSGKTLAFLLPILQHVLLEREHRGEMDTIWLQRQTASNENEKQGKHFKDNLSAIIITPTRELAQQISEQVKVFGSSLALIKPTLIVGGIFLEKQIRLIQQNTSIIIATPGRLWDVMKSFGSPIDFTFLRFLVLDEADRMVAAGSFEELHSIIDHIHMELNRREQEQKQVKEMIIERSRKAQQGDEEEDKKEIKNSPINKRQRSQTTSDDDNNHDNGEDGKFKPRSRFEQPKRSNKKIDFGPTFADAASFNVDTYLAKIAKQRGDDPRQGKKEEKEENQPKELKGKKDQQKLISNSSPKTVSIQAEAKIANQSSKKVAERSSSTQASKASAPTKGKAAETPKNIQKQAIKKTPIVASSTSEEEAEELDEDFEDIEDEDDDMNYLLNQTDDEDVELDEDIEEFDEDNEEFDEDDEDTQGADADEANQYVQLSQQLEATQRLSLKDAMYQKYTNLPNKIPHKLQVFLFSATLALQDSAREQESKRTKISARELSKKQGQLASRLNPISQTVDDLAEKQRLEQLKKQYEDGKTRLVELSRRLTLESPFIIDLSSSLILPPTLQQYSVELAETTSRDQALYGLLYNQDVSALVFTNSVNMTRKVADFLKCLNVNAVALHSEADQKGRMKIIEKFRKDSANIHKQKEVQRLADVDAGFENRVLQARGLPQSAGSKQQNINNNNNNNKGKGGKIAQLKKYGSVLVCTDIVARGLDIPNLDLVIHYHVPFDAETYIHRCGRTARGDNHGKSVVIVSPQEDNLWRVIQHALHVGLARDKTDQQKKLDDSFTPADVKKVNFNSKYLVHIRDRLGYAHKLAEKDIEDKTQKKEQEYDHKLRDAMGFDDDEEWDLTKKEKNRRKNETDGIAAHYRDQEKRSLQHAKVTLRELLQKNIHTHGGSFDW